MQLSIYTKQALMAWNSTVLSRLPFYFVPFNHATIAFFWESAEVILISPNL